MLLSGSTRRDRFVRRRVPQNPGSICARKARRQYRTSLLVAGPASRKQPASSGAYGRLLRPFPWAYWAGAKQMLYDVADPVGVLRNVRASSKAGVAR